MLEGSRLEREIKNTPPAKQAPEKTFGKVKTEEEKLEDIFQAIREEYPEWKSLSRWR